MECYVIVGGLEGTAEGTNKGTAMLCLGHFGVISKNVINLTPSYNYVTITLKLIILML